MEFGLLMTDTPVYVSCKFEMYIFKIALDISEDVCIVFLCVLSIFYLNHNPVLILAYKTCFMFI